MLNRIRALALCISMAPIIGNTQPVSVLPQQRSNAGSDKGQERYAGHDIVALIKQVNTQGVGSEKGEFETTAEYEARVKASVPTNDWTFILDDSAAPFVYNADTNNMTLEVTTVFKNFYSQPAGLSLLTVSLRSVLRETSRYTGSNAFGVEKLITSKKYDEYGIVVAPASPIDIDRRLIFPMQRDEARVRKQFLRLALTCTVTEGRIYRYSESQSPTLSDPYEIDRTQYFVPVSIHAAKVVDVRSGELVADLSLQGRPKGDSANLQSGLASARVPISQAGSDRVPNVGSQVPPTPSRIKAEPDVQSARIAKYVKPNYPPLARQARIQGVVRFTVLIGKDGKVESTQVNSGHPLLIQAALDAVKLWEYEPVKVNGFPVEVITTVDVTFSLNN